MAVKWYGHAFEWRSPLTDSQETNALRAEVENAKVTLYNNGKVK